MAELVFTGMAKYLRVGSKGNRFKLVVDDMSLSKAVQDAIDDSVGKHKMDSDVRILKPQDFVRNKVVEVRVR